MSAVRELKAETTPRFQASVENEPREVLGPRGQGRIIGFSSAAASSGFILEPSTTHGLIDLDRLDYLSRDIYVGPTGPAGSSSGTAGGVATSVAGGVATNVAVGPSAPYANTGSFSGTAGGVATSVATAFSGGSYIATAPVVSWVGATGPTFTARSTANTGTTVTVSAIFEPASNTGAIAVPADATSDPLTGYSRYSIPNWDGYGAKAITSETITAAKRFLRDLPETLGEPDIAPGADGTIGLEWSFRNRTLRKLFIDIGPGNQWSGYWRRSTGEKRTLPPTVIGAATKASLQVLFDDLNS